MENLFKRETKINWAEIQTHLEMGKGVKLTFTTEDEVMLVMYNGYLLAVDEGKAFIETIEDNLLTDEVVTFFLEQLDNINYHYYRQDLKVDMIQSIDVYDMLLTYEII